MKVSIIIPVYNVAPYLLRAIKSVQTQDFVDWEVVLVDDGSTDGSSEQCDRIASADSRIKVVHQSNSGVVVARQNGFSASTGEWILFLDGDDELAPGVLSHLVEQINVANADICRFGFVMIRQGGDVYDYPPPRYATKSLNELIAGVVATPLEITGTCIGDKIYRRSVALAAFKDVGDVQIKHSEDGLFALAALLRATTFVTIPIVGYRYYLRSGSAVHRFNADLVREKDVFNDRALALVAKSLYSDEKLLARMRVHHAYEAMGFLYSCVLRWSGTRRQVVELLASARISRFMQDARPALNAMPRRVKAFLIYHPAFMLVYRGLFKLRRRGICE